VNDLSMQRELLLLSDGTWARTRARLEGLTDEELLWQPAPGCWTVRPLADGTWITDGTVEQRSEPPFTTIAWRMVHLIGCYGSDRNSRWLGVEVPLPPIEDSIVPAPHTASESIAVLEEAHARWRAVIEVADDAILAEPIGAVGGQYGEAPKAGLLIHQLDEVIHHAAEIAVLRDLYRAQREPAHPDPAIAALVTAPTMPDGDAFRSAPADTVVGALAELGRFDLVEAAVALGLPVDGPPPTALHRAAAMGRAEVVEQLVAAGADMSVRDPSWNATPAEWAAFFRHHDLAARLRP
jgi:hypothetical protein